MPTYEYTCKLCGETLEVFQSFSEKPLRKHPDCGGELKKVFNARGVVFKGSGFYSTDSRSSTSSKKSDPAKKDGASKSEPSKGEKPKADPAKAASSSSKPD
jgi:putative FmdB family regulatory protein